MRCFFPSLPIVSSSMNWTEIRVCREYVWGLFSEEAGHVGKDFDFFLTLCRTSFVLELGVMVGTQKEGSLGSVACERS